MGWEQDLLDQQRETNRLLGQMASGKGSSSSGNLTGGTGGSTTSGIKEADGVISGLIGQFRRLTQGSSMTADGLEGLGRVLQKTPLIGGTLNSVFGTLTGTAQEQIAVNNKLTLAGASFQGNLVDQATTIARSGLTNQQFIRQLETLGPGITGLGSTSKDAIKNLTEFQESFRNTDVGKMLANAGMNPEQINQYVNAMVVNKNLNISDAASKREALAATEGFTKEIIRNAQATGQSADALLKKNALDNDNLDVTTTMIEQGAEATKAWNNMQGVLVEMPSSIKSMVGEAFSPEGVTSDKAAATFGALGDAGPMLLEAVRLQKEAAKEGASPALKKQADELMLQARNAVDARMRDPQFLSMARIGQRGQGGEAENAAAQLARERGALSRSQIATEQRLGTAGLPTDPATVRAYQEEQARRTLALQNAQGQQPAGAQLIGAVQAVDTASIARSQKLVVDGMNSLAGGADAAAKKLYGLAGVKPGEAVTPGSIVSPPGTPNASQSRVPKNPRYEQRHEGTEGILKSLFEPKDTTVRIKAGENVLDPENAKKWAQLGGSSGIDQMISGMLPKMADIKMPKGASDINNMFDSMSSTMSTGVPMTKDLFGNLKSQVSALSTDMAANKTAPVAEEAESTSSTSTAATDATNNEMLSVLNNLNKHMSQLVAISENGNQIAESMTRKITSSSRFEA